MKGDLVKINYTGKVKGSNDVFDTTLEKVAKDANVYNKNRRYEPVTVLVGKGDVLKGIDEALESMKAGEERELVLSPDKAFGLRNPSLVKVVPLAQFKKSNVDPKPGMVLDLNGQPARIQSVAGGRVRVDFNHPLAGRDVLFEVKVEAIAQSPEEKAKFLYARTFGFEPDKAEVAGSEVKFTNDEISNIKKKLSEEIFENMDGISRVVFVDQCEKGKKEG